MVKASSALARLHSMLVHRHFALNFDIYHYCNLEQIPSGIANTTASGKRIFFLHDKWAETA